MRVFETLRVASMNTSSFFRLVGVVAALEARASVEIARPVVIAASPAEIRGMTAGKTEGACTTFRAARLECACHEVRNGFRLQPRVRMIPHVYIADFRYVEHEFLHIRDFRTYLDDHVNALRSEKFRSREACEARAAATMGAFPETMKRIARLSSARRDGHRFSSEDHLVVVQAKVMPELVDDGLADLANGLATAARNPKDGTAKDGDLIRQRGKHVEGSLGQRHAAVDSEKLVVLRVLTKSFEVLVRRLFLYHDDHVVE